MSSDFSKQYQVKTFEVMRFLYPGGYVNCRFWKLDVLWMYCTTIKLLTLLSEKRGYFKYLKHFLCLLFVSFVHTLPLVSLHCKRSKYSFLPYLALADSALYDGTERKHDRLKQRNTIFATIRHRHYHYCKIATRLKNVKIYFLWPFTVASH